MPPTLLEQVVREAIDELTDEDALLAAREAEKADRERLRAAVEDMSVPDLIEEYGLHDPSVLAVVETLRLRDSEAT